MFTLTFRKQTSGHCTDTVVAAQKYLKDERSADNNSPVTSCLVITYEKLDSATGCEHFIDGPECAGSKEYDVCFITNHSGKTIDRIGPFPPPEQESKT